MTLAEIDDWHRRKARIIAKYGSADAASAPCPRERFLLAAVTAWRTTSEEWTLSVDGWRGDGWAYREMPTQALQAIREAYPLPTTFAEARAEIDYWTRRNAELRDVLSEDGTFTDDIALDLVAEVRAAITRDLALFALPVTTIGDLHTRCTMHREAGVDDPRFAKALYRDIQAMAEASTPHPTITRTGLSDRLGAALSADPSRSNRDIARSLHCSPTTVGHARAAMGLQSKTRVVSRGGQKFDMRVALAQG